MTTTTLSRVPDAARRGARRGFTLVEVLISSSLAAFILTGVLTCFLFLGRSGANIQNYSDMDGQARRGLEQFAQDIRQASSITWNGPSDVTLIVDSQYIRYYYSTTAPSGSSLTGNFLYRTAPSGTAPSIPASPPLSTLVLSGITAPVARTSDTDTACTPLFRAYDINGNQLKYLEYASPSATDLTNGGKTTKQLQIALEAARVSRTAARATNLVLSARYILRNKQVTA